MNQIADSLEKLDDLQNEMNETLMNLDLVIVTCDTPCSALSRNYATRFSNYLVTVSMCILYIMLHTQVYSTPLCYIHYIQHTFMLHTLYTVHLYVTCTIYSTPLCYIHYIQYTSMLHTLRIYSTPPRYIHYIQYTSMLHTLYTVHLYVTYTIYSTPLCYIHYIQYTSMLHALYPLSEGDTHK